MAWSNLLSGLIGALLGGLFSIVASVITMRQQRSQARQGASHTASSAIVDNILAIKQAMLDVQAAKDSRTTRRSRRFMQPPNASCSYTMF
jgi:hypothetical protein